MGGQLDGLFVSLAACFLQINELNWIELTGSQHCLKRTRCTIFLRFYFSVNSYSHCGVNGSTIPAPWFAKSFFQIVWITDAVHTYLFTDIECYDIYKCVEWDENKKLYRILLFGASASRREYAPSLPLPCSSKGVHTPRCLDKIRDDRTETRNSCAGHSPVQSIGHARIVVDAALRRIG